jgi:hypothetical protein
MCHNDLYIILTTLSSVRPKKMARTKQTARAKHKRDAKSAQDDENVDEMEVDIDLTAEVNTHIYP